MPGPWQCFFQKEYRDQRFDILKFTLSSSLLPGDCLIYIFRKFKEEEEEKEEKEEEEAEEENRDHKCLTYCPIFPMKHRVSSVLGTRTSFWGLGRCPLYQFRTVTQDEGGSCALEIFQVLSNQSHLWQCLSLMKTDFIHRHGDIQSQNWTVLLQWDGYLSELEPENTAMMATQACSLKLMDYWKLREVGWQWWQTGLAFE